jgi:sigma-B regulation protein RsbU (phosphoserine phosphatase)
MPESLQIRVYENQNLLFSTECSGTVELGRQSEGEREPYFRVHKDDHWRIVLARLDEDGLSRHHARTESLPDGRIRLINNSESIPIRLENGSELQPKCSLDAALPLTFYLGPRMVRIEPAGTAVNELRSLAEAPLPPGADEIRPSRFATVAAAAGSSGESLSRWLQAATNVLQSAAISLDFFDRAAGALVDAVGFDAGRVLLLEKGEWNLRAQKTVSHLAADEWQPSRLVLGKILEEKRTFWHMPAVTEGSLIGVNALVAAPILDRGGEVIGALYGDRSQAARRGSFGAGPISQLEAMQVELLASAVATGLARLEQEQATLQSQKKLLLIARDLEIGRDIQAGFLPDELFQVTGWEIRSHFRPAREVSGDFYDVFKLPHGHLALVVADVCDKGVGAALYMALFRSLLRAFAQQTSGHGMLGWGEAADLGASSAAARRRDTLLADLTALLTVEFTNNYVAQTHAKACMFATMFFGVLDPATGALTYVNAGHDAPVLVAADGGQTRLTPTGPVVGTMPNIAYDINRVDLKPGDTLLAYTDGVTEARDPAGKFFTEKRLLSILDGSAQSASALLDSVVAKLHEHIAGAEPYDDVTMLAVRRGI